VSAVIAINDTLTTTTGRSWQPDFEDIRSFSGGWQALPFEENENRLRTGTPPPEDLIP
jgi:hypothetical protein